MAGGKSKADLNVIAEGYGFDKLARDIALVTRGLKSLSKVRGDINKKLGLTKGKAGLKNRDIARMGGIDEGMFNVSKRGRNKGDLTTLNKEGAKATKMLKGFRMQFLSTMFFGQMVWRQFSTFFSSMIENYKKLDSKGNRPLTKSLTKLSASFTYLKFQILDAMGPVLIKMFGSLAEAMMWIADMNPSTLGAIAIGLSALGVAFGVMAVASTVTLFSDAVSSIIALSKIKGEKLGAVATGLEKITPALKGIGATVAIAALVKINYDMLTTESDHKSRLWSILGGTLAGALGGALIGSMILPGAGTVVGAGIGAMVGFGITFSVSVADFISEDKPTVGDMNNAIKNLFSNWTGAGALLAAAGTGGMSLVLPVFVEMQKATEARQDNIIDLDDPANQATQLNDSIKTFGQMATPESITALNDLYQNGIIPGLATNMNESLLPAWQTFDSEVLATEKVMDTMISNWRDWTPEEKTLIINVERRGDSGGPSFDGSEAQVTGG